MSRKLWLSTVTVAIALLAVFAGGAVAKSGATGGTLTVDNHTDDGHPAGLDATARLPLATMEADGQIAH